MHAADAFSGVAPTGKGPARWLYFSFVTLATLGYGDIVPRADVARSLAIVEGVGGQLFLAVLVARLVSLYSKPGNQSR
jgi:voltage-gated potassium channel Kch